MAKKVKPVLKSFQYRTLYKRGKKHPLIEDGREDCLCLLAGRFSREIVVFYTRTRQIHMSLVRRTSVNKNKHRCA